MKTRIFAVALVVLMLVGALVLASCSNCKGDGVCDTSSDVTDLYNCALETLDLSTGDWTCGSFKGAGKPGNCDC